MHGYRSHSRFVRLGNLALIAALVVAQTPLPISRADAAATGSSSLAAGSAPPVPLINLESYQPDLFTGRAVLNIPLPVPPGRKGVQPQLTLVYNSSGQNGWLGVGWDLDLGFIERSTRFGVPHYDDNDAFCFQFQGVNSDLVQVYDGTYRAKDEGLFLRFVFRGEQGWEVTDRSGTRYYFGESPSARIQDAGKVFRWCLERIVDVNGNEILISYAVHDGLPYLSTIEYTAHSSGFPAAANRVVFILEERPDVESSCRMGFDVRTSRRLTAVETYTTLDGALTLANRYAFSYRPSARTGRSLLESLTTFGADGTTASPPRTFSYSDADSLTYSKTSNQGTTAPVAWNVRVAGKDTGHENWGCCPPNASLPWWSPVIVSGYHNFGSVQVTVNPDGSIYVQGAKDHFVHAWTAVYFSEPTTVNLTASGVWDVCCLYLQEGVYPERTNLGNYTFQPGWTLVHIVAYHQHDGFHCGLSTPLAQLADVMSPSVVSVPRLAGDAQGDAFADLINFDPDSGKWTVSSVQAGAPGEGDTWLTGFGDASQIPLVGDWNGDGRCDLALYKSGNWRFALSSGSAFQADAIAQTSFGQGEPAVGDFNGDGVMDICTYYQGHWQVALGDGSGFSPAAGFDLVMSEGALQLPEDDVRWKVRKAGWDRCHDNYGVEHPYNTSVPYGPYTYVSGSVNLGGVNVSVDGAGRINVDGAKDHYAHSRIAVYLLEPRSITLTGDRGWDVAGRWIEDETGVHGPYGKSVTYSFRKGWTTLHITGYNQNQGFNYRSTAPLTSLFDVVSPDPIEIDESPGEHLTGDFNGDGLTDIALIIDGQIHVALSTGSGFLRRPGQALGMGDNDYTTADVDGDGRSDILWFNRNDGSVLIARAVDGGFRAPETVPVTFSLTGNRTQLQVADWNGDGSADLGVFDPVTGDTELALSQGSPPDLLSGVYNGLGGSLHLDYVPSSSCSNYFLPFVVQTVGSLGISDGIGSTSHTSYAYSGGRYDPATREFRGFRSVRTDDDSGRSLTTEFRQDLHDKGRPATVEIRDSSGNLWSKEVRSWNSVTPYPGLDVYFTYLQQLDLYTYDGDETFRHTRFRFQYDDYGNLLNSYADGEVGVSGDESSTLRFYTYNLDAWILDKPYLIQTLDSGGRVVAQVRYYYDGHSDLQAAPERGNLTCEEEWLGQPVEKWIATTLQYDDYGNVIASTDARGATTSNTYDDSGTYIVRTVNALGHSVSAVYDPRTGRILAATDQNGVTTLHSYDALGRLIETAVVDPAGGETNVTVEISYRYDTLPLRTRTVVYAEPHRGGAMLGFRFMDGFGRTIQTRGQSDDPLTQVVSDSVRYDGNGRVVRVWAPYLDSYSEEYVPPESVSGIASPTVYTYDPLNRVTQVLLPDGSQTSTTFDDWTVTFSDAAGNRIRRTYDARGKAIRVEEFHGDASYSTRYYYDSLGNLTSVVDHAGNEIRMTYDSQNRRLSVVDPDMGEWTFSYDDDDNLIRQVDSRGVEISFSYDLLGRLVRKSYSVPQDSGVVHLEDAVYVYDDPLAPYSTGKLCRVTDSSGTLSYSYDYLNRATQEDYSIDGVTYSVQRSYDLLGRLCSLTYPDGARISYQYGLQGGVRSLVLERNGTQTTILDGITYDPLGRVTGMTFGDGSRTALEYDPATRRLVSLSTVSAESQTLQSLVYDYDAVGNLVSIQDSLYSATQLFTYDQLNRLRTATGENYGTLLYEYDPLGNLIRKGGMQLSYDDPRRPHAVTSTDTGLQLTYDANGNLVRRVDSASTLEMQYDAENRLAAVRKPTCAEAPRTLDPGWNLISAPGFPDETGIRDLLSSLGIPWSQVSRFDTEADHFESCNSLPEWDQFCATHPWEGYCVLVSAATNVSLPVYPSYATNTVYLQAGWHLLAGPPVDMTVEEWLSPLQEGTHYSTVQGFDASAQQFSEASRVHPGSAYWVEVVRGMHWTPPGAPDLTEVARYYYNADGARVKKVTPDGTTIYIGDLFQKDPDGAGRDFVYLGSLLVAVVEPDGSLLYVHPDHLASPNVVCDSSGNVLNVLEYRPFGSLTSYPPDTPPFLFSGRRLDPETGFYYLNSRYYDPQLGRFIQPDALVQKPDDPQSLNRYSYARNNPLLLTDPSGQFFGFLAPFIYGAIIGSIVNVAIAAITGADLGDAALLGALQGGVLSVFSAFANNVIAGVRFVDYAARGAIFVSGSAAASAAGAAVRGEPVGKAALAGARFGAIMYSANYIVGLWSGWSRDQAEVIYNDEVNPQHALAGRIGVNGIATPRENAIRLMREHRYDAWLYNPTHGPLALGDLVEAMQEHLFGPSSWSRTAAPLLNQAARSGLVCSIIAHSQGGMQLGQALALMDSGASFASGSSVSFVKTHIDP
ncbi:MAG TPA: hypothetical protein EYP62_03225, partial [Kiritimatiellae bacterium]|nr:hypothetical protein [Kiritimatiellia bacterium]